MPLFRDRVLKLFSCLHWVKTATGMMDLLLPGNAMSILRGVLGCEALVCVHLLFSWEVSFVSRCMQREGGSEILEWGYKIGEIERT